MVIALLFSRSPAHSSIPRPVKTVNGLSANSFLTSKSRNAGSGSVAVAKDAAKAARVPTILPTMAKSVSVRATSASSHSIATGNSSMTGAFTRADFAAWRPERRETRMRPAADGQRPNTNTAARL